LRTSNNFRHELEESTALIDAGYYVLIFELGGFFLMEVSAIKIVENWEKM